MLPSRVTHLLLVLAALVVAAPGCAAPAATQSSVDAIGVDFDAFPSRPEIESAMDNYLQDPASARARDPMSLNDFFHADIDSINGENMTVELLKPNPRYSDLPVAILHATFLSDQSDIFDNRYNDVILFNLADSLGVAENPFPEAVIVPGETASLVRVWTDFRTVDQGPPRMRKADLLAEVARMAVWSYVTGNTDGPAVNGGNGGFAKFRDESGRSFWRGVLIDGGRAFGDVSNYVSADDGHPFIQDLREPWNSDICGTGPVTADNIPQAVIDALTQIARSTLADLAQYAGLDRSLPTYSQLKSAMPGVRSRAQAVLQYYGFTWN